MKQKSFDSAIIQKAIREAKSARYQSDFSFFKLGAVIFTNNRILVAGCNTNRTSPMQYRYNKYRPYRIDTCCCHAEMAALIRLKKLYPNADPDDLSILVYRETARGNLALAKPCAACERAIRDFGIRHVYYSGKDSFVYEKYKKS